MNSTGGYVFRIFRETHGLTLRQVGAAVGVSHGHLSRIETGQAYWSRELDQRLTNFYGTYGTARFQGESA